METVSLSEVRAEVLVSRRLMARRLGAKYGHSSGLRFSLSLSYDLVGVAIFCREFVVAFEQALFLSLLCLLADGLLSIDR